MIQEQFVKYEGIIPFAYYYEELNESIGFCYYQGEEWIALDNEQPLVKVVEKVKVQRVSCEWEYIEAGKVGVHGEIEVKIRYIAKKQQGSVYTVIGRLPYEHYIDRQEGSEPKIDAFIDVESYLVDLWIYTEEEQKIRCYFTLIIIMHP